MTRSALASRFTGIFTSLGPPPGRAHDPAVALCSGLVAPLGPRAVEIAVGGAGWTPEQAEGACLGEAIERLQPYPLPRDRSIEASHARWPLDEPAIAPGRWVLFLPEQYAQPGFPFAPFERDTTCRWTCFRDARSGLPAWIPEELGFLYGRAGAPHRIASAISTGLSCGRAGGPVLLRGLEEAIERDALVGAWWGRYPLEEREGAQVLASLGDPDLPARLLRPNLRYRFFRVRTPLAAHVAVVTLAGEDLEGHVFSAGAACRETRGASWRKAILEAVQGRHYVRWLLAKGAGEERGEPRPPADFSEHATYFSRFPDRLERTALARATGASRDDDEGLVEGIDAHIERLGPERPVLARDMTPPAIAAERTGWRVLKVVVPGLQPLHGNHLLPHLGGPLWAPRALSAWAATEPHPFP